MKGEELIKSLVSSTHRRELLFSLMDSPKPLRYLQSIVNASSSVLAHALSYLEGENLVEKEKGTRSWRLTNKGLIAAKVLKSAMEAFQVLEKFEDFWLNHEMSWLDDNLLLHLGKLKNTELFAYDGINYPHIKYIEEIRNARWLKAVSGMILNEYTEVYPSLVEKGVKIELILSEEVLDYVRRFLRDSLGMSLGEYLDAHPNLRVFRLDFKPSVAFTVTDAYFSMGCLTPEGLYDLNTTLMGWDEDSMSFGLMLFEHYRSRAREVRE